MSKSKRTPKRTPNAPTLVFLLELSKLSGVSYPSLNRYKTMGQLDAIMIGSGRTARFKRSAAAIKLVCKLRNEGLAKRGRPAKSPQKFAVSPKPIVKLRVAVKAKAAKSVPAKRRKA